MLGQVSFPRDPAKARAARQWACKTAGHLVDDYELRLCVDELFANACDHTLTDWINVLVAFDGDVLLVEVVDDGTGVWEAPTDIERGRGLFLVEMMSSDWGVTHDSRATTVWFTMKACVPL